MPLKKKPIQNTYSTLTLAYVLQNSEKKSKRKKNTRTVKLLDDISNKLILMKYLFLFLFLFQLAVLSAFFSCSSLV